MKLLFQLFSSLVIISCLQACAKVKVEVINKPNQVLFSRNALEYVKLIPGKYLIYKDSATAEVDSVIVSESRLNTSHHAAGNPSWLYPAFESEGFYLELNKVVPTGGLSSWFTGVAQAYNPYTFGNTFSDTNTVTLIDLNSGMDVFYSTHSQINNQFITIEGKNYNNIVITTRTQGTINQPGYKKTIYYWAKPMGIIKRTVIMNGQAKTSNLVRNN